MRNELKYYTQYLRIPQDAGYDNGPGTLCHFGTSSTLRGVKIGDKAYLTLDEALLQCDEWTRSTLDDNRYVVYGGADVETGVTPFLPGMADRDFLPRTRAGIGHVVGQGGRCWCGDRHADAVKGDPVSLPAGTDYADVPFAAQGPLPDPSVYEPGEYK